MMMKLKRDPVVLLNFVAAVVMGVGDWVLPLTGEQQAVLNAVALAVANFVAATLVHDGQLPMLSGLAKAVLAAVVGFGLKLSPDLQVTIMSAVAWLGSLWVRTQVAPKDAPTPPALAEPVVEVNSTVGQVSTSARASF